MSPRISLVKGRATGAFLALAMAPACAVAQSDADEAFVAELAPADKASESRSAVNKIIIRKADGTSREIEVDGSTMVFIGEDGETRTMEGGPHRFNFMTMRRHDNDTDTDTDSDSDSDDAAADAFSGEFFQRDGDTIIFDMDHLRRGVARARDRASAMQGRAMIHFNRAMNRMHDFAGTMDEEWLDRSKLDRLVDRIERTEARMRAGIEREWQGGLSTMLDRLAREIEDIEREGGETVTAAGEARRQALADARVELEKAEDFRRQALEQAADELRTARQQLEQRREALRKARETEKQE